MPNVNEVSQWESGVYRIETTDPVIGGENGIANVQAKQLANRTQYLKSRADQVDQAAAGFGSLDVRLDQMAASTEALGPDMQNMTAAVIKFALDQAALANGGVKALRQQAQQEGEFTIKNRGVISGLSLSRSVTAARNLNISAGLCFANGRSYSVAAAINAASVPSNIGGSNVMVFAYLYQGADQLWRLAVTAIGQQVPDSGIKIYSLIVPGNSTDATDPNLGGVSLTDIRRIEPGFPMSLSSPASASPWLEALSANDYRLDFDVVSAVGTPCHEQSIVVSSRATNGFTVLLASAADDVVVRYRASKLNQ